MQVAKRGGHQRNAEPGRDHADERMHLGRLLRDIHHEPFLLAGGDDPGVEGRRLARRKHDEGFACQFAEADDVARREWMSVGQGDQERLAVDDFETQVGGFRHRHPHQADVRFPARQRFDL
nr:MULTISPECIES: hypothetical protein [unclassified Bradyrhizobium]